MVQRILLLGDPALYETSEPVRKSELGSLSMLLRDLRDTLFEYRAVHGAGRAIAAPQIGVKKRVIYMFVHSPTVFINPTLSFPDDELMPVLDDCMSFPGLLVSLTRRRRCTVKYRDADWNEQTAEFDGDLSELIQHEYDHLDGILATMRAEDGKAFFMTETKNGGRR